MPDEPDEKPAGGGLNPNALAIPQAARLLSKVGGERVSEEMIRRDLEAGAPVNPDGTINLVHYAAWLVKEMARGDRPRSPWLNSPAMRLVDFSGFTH
jgi:hypothetical protein